MKRLKKKASLNIRKVGEMIKLMQIKRAIKSNKKLLKQEYGVKEIGIFGSFAKGKQKGKSDIDVLVDFDSVPDLIKFIQLERKLQTLLGKKVDLVRKQRSEEHTSELQSHVNL